MHKFFVPEASFSDGFVNIEGEDVKHIYRVLRLKEGEKININNCLGTEFLSEIVTISKTNVNCKILGKVDINNESPIQISLYQGLPKAAKMDLIVQKATELGVMSVTPIITERVVVKNEIGEYKKIDRWNRIALEACKQSKRTIIPKVNSVIDFQKLTEQLKNVDLVIVPYENQEEIGLKNVMQKLDKNKIKTVAIIIGPEGGFEKEEIEAFKKLGGHIVTLGPRILRTETAGFVCASLLMYELGDIGGI